MLTQITCKIQAFAVMSSSEKPSFGNFAQNYLVKYVSVGNYSFFAQFWKPKFDLKRNKASYGMF